MSKKLARLINPGLGLYFWVMLGFILAALLLGQYLLAGVEAVVVFLLYLSYLIMRKTRHRQMLRYIQNAPTATVRAPSLLLSSGYMTAVLCGLTTNLQTLQSFPTV